MKKKKVSSIFKAHEKPAYENIYIENQNVKVRICWEEKFEFILSFIFENQHFSAKLDAIQSKEKLFCSKDINFEGIELHENERNNLANCLNEILNYYFD